MSFIPPPNEASDIFSLSDQALSERYQFVEEIGFGNWGSVWLCRPKDDDGRPIDDSVADVHGIGKVAVKLVHRSKTPTTAARVRSLWNEMKIVRSFKNDPHPSIIPFHNFIITPSYALITMAYLPTLVPVEVPELRAKPWFLSLISAVAFLHARGVVHNDIKPANILLTASDPPMPVLVDFGFAEKYDSRSSKAFLSNLAYGTPEYLSPERARGLPHDTRKSDVWSLGVTLFEILRGRTPFEHAEPDGTTETFSTKADLEKYWARTVKGKWVGKWSMSRGLEKLLRKMILPNADLRITAPVALNDPYFDPAKPETPRTRQSRSSITMRSLSSETEASRLVEVAPPWADHSGPGTGFSPPPSLLKTVAAAARNRANAHAKSAPGKENVRSGANANSATRKENGGGDGRRESAHGHKRTQSAKDVPSSQSRLPALVQPFKHGARRAPSFNAGTSAATSPKTHTPASGPLATRQPVNVSMTTSTGANADTSHLTATTNRGSVLTSSSLASKENSVPGSRTGSGRRVPVRKPVPAIFAAAHKGKKKDNTDNILYEDVSAEKGEKERRRKSRVLVDLTKTKANGAPKSEAMAPGLESCEVGGKTPLPPVMESDSPRLFPNDTFPRSTKESTGIGALKQSIKQSLDKGVRLYKSSALGSYSNLLAKQSTGGLSSVAPECSRNRDNERSSEDTRESWENDAAVRNAKSSLPVVRHAIRNEQVAADNRLDRMTIWIRNVEKVVEDARANFAAGSMTPLPPLPPRVPHSSRRALKVDEIFRDDDGAVASTSTGDSTTSRPRRVTLLSRSPEPLVRESFERSQDGKSSPENKNERNTKAQSAFNLSRPITPITTLQFEIDRKDAPTRSPTRLSAVLDPNAFFAPKPSEDDLRPSVKEESYTPTERPCTLLNAPDSERLSPSPGPDPTVDTYDQLLMASSGVKRLGKGYQSNIVTSSIVQAVPASAFKRNPKIFLSARRGMLPPPETPRKSVSVDELGALSSTQKAAGTRREEGNNTIKLMRRAFKAITGGGSVSRRLSGAA